MLYAKYYIYLKILKEENKKREFNLDLLGNLCYLEYILKIEKSICNRKNPIAKFDKFNRIFKTYNMMPDFLCLFKKNGIFKCIQ